MYVHVQSEEFFHVVFYENPSPMLMAPYKNRYCRAVTCRASVRGDEGEEEGSSQDINK